MANFFAWVTATTNLSADPLIAGLVRTGYEVKVLASNGELIEQGEVTWWPLLLGPGWNFTWPS